MKAPGSAAAIPAAVATAAQMNSGVGKVHLGLFLTLAVFRFALVGHRIAGKERVVGPVFAVAGQSPD